MTDYTEAQILDFDTDDSDFEVGPRAARQTIWQVSLTLVVAMVIGIAAGAADQHRQGHGVYQISLSN